MCKVLKGAADQGPACQYPLLDFRRRSMGRGESQQAKSGFGGFFFSVSP